MAEEREFDTSIDQVRLTVPTTDDDNLKALTFRTWILGITCCSLQAFCTAFFSLRQNPLSIPLICIQIVIHPIGRFMEAFLPNKFITVPALGLRVSINPGKFNVKEHAMISIFTSTGSIVPLAVQIIIALKAYYHRRVHFMVGMMITLSTQLLGYGFAGLFLRFLVDSPHMSWPSTLMEVTFYRTFHDEEVRTKGQITRLQFFLMVLVASFAYHLTPGYLFPSASAFSVICLLWRDSVIAHQLGAGRNGLGIASFGLDWQTITGYTGDPLSTPFFVMNNIIIGFFIAFFVVTPLAYWTNSFRAKAFPIFSSDIFDFDGRRYNVSRVIKEESFTFDEEGYTNYSKVYLSIFLAYSYGLRFASVTAALVHVPLYNGRDIWKKFKEAGEQIRGDVYNRLMESYDPVPKLWFYAISVITFFVATFCCQRGIGEDTSLPFWAIAVACAVGLFLLLPVATIFATTTQTLPVSVVADLLIGYFNPGKPFANMIFKNYTIGGLSQAVYCLSIFKFGHYMKLPPKSVFIVLVTGSTISACVHFSTVWFLLSTVTDVCNPDKLPEGSPWTCPSNKLFYNTSIMWGLVGPSRLFAPHGVYAKIVYFFLFGAVAPLVFWKVSRRFPHKKWLRLIHMPVILSAVSTAPPGGPVNFLSWYLVGTISNLVYKKNKGFWVRYNYVLSASLAAGSSFLAIFVYFTLNRYGVFGPKWWGLQVDDHCPLAHCPTAPGIVVDGCPVYSG